MGYELAAIIFATCAGFALVIHAIGKAGQ